jgi:hypothetical protein
VWYYLRVEAAFLRCRKLSLLWSSNQKCKIIEQKNASAQAKVKQKRKMVEQKTSSGSSKKMQDVEQKLEVKQKIQDGRKNASVEQKLN